MLHRCSLTAVRPAGDMRTLHTKYTTVWRRYPILNKPWVLSQWFKIAKPTEDFFLVLDSDMIIHRPFLPEQHQVAPGEMIRMRAHSCPAAAGAMPRQSIDYESPCSDFTTATLALCRFMLLGPSLCDCTGHSSMIHPGPMSGLH